jgi:hypothetical protein
VGAIIAMLVGLLGALLPERLRTRLGLESALPVPLFTGVTAVLELTAAGALVWLYFAANNGVRGILEPGVGLAGLAHVVAAAPYLWAGVAYLAVEGALRLMAAGVGQGAAVLPAWLIDQLWLGARRGVAHGARTRAVPDVVERDVGSARYRIGSCRDYGWDTLTTVEVRGEQLRVVAQRHDAAPPYAHVYLLGEPTPGWVARGATVRYDPRAVVRAEAAPALTPGDVRAAGRALTGLVPTLPATLGTAAALLVSPLVCLLPERTRARLALTGLWLAPFTMITGLAELGAGLAMTIVYALPPHPLVFLGLMLLLEGLVRTLAGFMGVDVGLIVAWVIERVFMGADQVTRAVGRLPPLADVVHRDDAQRLVIHSCKARDFRPETTLLVEGAPHRVVSWSRSEDGLRPFVYVLEPTPPHWIDRHRVDYTPELVLAE